MSQKEQMLHDIGIVSFAVVDLMEFLDTHPTDHNAIKYFNYYSKMKTQMEQEFSRKYYPLRVDLAESNGEWRWGMAPLPWGGVCD